MHGSKTLAYDPDSQLIDLENLIAANARRSDGGFQSRVGEVRILCVDNPHCCRPFSNSLLRILG